MIRRENKRTQTFSYSSEFYEARFFGTLFMHVHVYYVCVCVGCIWSFVQFTRSRLIFFSLFFSSLVQYGLFEFFFSFLEFPFHFFHWEALYWKSKIRRFDSFELDFFLCNVYKLYASLFLANILHFFFFYVLINFVL